MIHIFDGAMGTMLQAGGLEPGGCPELMNIENPEVVKNIHRAYIEAGSTIIETNTFGASSLKLDHYGLADRVAELNAAAVKIAKEAAAGRAKVAGSMGPTGRFVGLLWRGKRRTLQGVPCRCHNSRDSVSVVNLIP